MADFFEQLFLVLRTFSWTDALDILLVTLLVFGFIRLIRETRAAQLVKGIFILLVAWILSAQLNLKIVSLLLSNFFEFSILALLVIFQPEIRRALEKIGRTNIMTYFGNIKRYTIEEEKKNCITAIDQICKACMFFSKTKTGALIVFERETKLKEIANTGTYIKALISQELIGNIFFNKAPLHDGAMIIRHNRILTAGCILPLTKNADISPDLGTRHRAALGVSEISDAVVVVVSEETGTVSLALNGVMTRHYSEKKLKNRLIQLISPDKTNDENNQSFRLFGGKNNE